MTAIKAAIARLLEAFDADRPDPSNLPEETT